MDAIMVSEYEMGQDATREDAERYARWLEARLGQPVIVGDHTDSFEGQDSLWDEWLASERTREAAKSLGRKGGQAKTDAKAEAARANGAKGGRPPRRFPEHKALCALNHGDLVCDCGRGQETIEEIGKRARAKGPSEQEAFDDPMRF